MQNPLCAEYFKQQGGEDDNIMATVFNRNFNIKIDEKDASTLLINQKKGVLDEHC